MSAQTRRQTATANATNNPLREDIKKNQRRHKVMRREPNTTAHVFKYEYDPREYKIDKNRPIGSVNKIYNNGISGPKQLMELLYMYNVPLEHLDHDTREWLYRAL